MATSELSYRVRDAADVPEGALFLLHGRGANEHDLFPLFDILDPDRRLLGVSPRAPLSLPPGGSHWYRFMQLGYPEPATFRSTLARLAAWFDALLEDRGITPDRVVVGGFSQGSMVGYALSLATGRPRPAGLVALSGFMPTVDGLEYDLSNLDGWPVAIGHGTFDRVIGVEWGRQARERLEAAGADVTYRESPMEHTIDPAFLDELQMWIAKVLP